MNEQDINSIYETQRTIIVNSEKLSCRKLALEYAKNTDHANITQTLLENAEEIYAWLIMDMPK